MCGCNAKSKTAQVTYTVTYPASAEHPNGHTEVKTSVGAARIAVAKVPGATYHRTP